MSPHHLTWSGSKNNLLFGFSLVFGLISVLSTGIVGLGLILPATLWSRNAGS